jgi:hypothetical protein
MEKAEKELPDTAEDGGFADLSGLGLEILKEVNNLRVCRSERPQAGSFYDDLFQVIAPGGKVLRDFNNQAEAEVWAAETKDWTFDIRVISLDETEYYAIDEADRPFIKAMRGVYMYDKNQQTHCCELTPSYWLIHVEDQVIFTDKCPDYDDEKRDELEQKYANSTDTNGIYMHCHDVDALEEKLKGEKWRYRVHGDTEVSLGDVPYDDQIESLLEYFRGNLVVG